MAHCIFLALCLHIFPSEQARSFASAHSFGFFFTATEVIPALTIAKNVFYACTKDTWSRHVAHILYACVTQTPCSAVAHMDAHVAHVHADAQVMSAHMFGKAVDIFFDQPNDRPLCLNCSQPWCRLCVPPMPDKAAATPAPTVQSSRCEDTAWMNYVDWDRACA